MNKLFENMRKQTDDDMKIDLWMAERILCNSG